MGHAEAASGLCSLVKVLLAMETGVIAPNIHFDNPNKFVPALFNSELKVMMFLDFVILINTFRYSNFLRKKKTKEANNFFQIFISNSIS